MGLFSGIYFKFYLTKNWEMILNHIGTKIQLFD